MAIFRSSVVSSAVVWRLMLVVLYRPLSCGVAAFADFLLTQTAVGMSGEPRVVETQPMPDSSLVLYLGSR
jgi:hypothetical protein